MTADQVAAVIVAACRETGEDPVACATGKNGGLPGMTAKTCRARHYALQAIRDVMTDLDPNIAARLVGAPCDPGTFVRVSTFQVAKPIVGTSRRKALWWREEQFARVVAACRAAAMPAQGSTQADSRKLPPRSSAVQKLPAAPPKGGAHGPPRTALDRFVDHTGPASYHAGGDDQLAGREREKRACRDLLAEAVANTAKLQAKLPKEGDD